MQQRPKLKMFFLESFFYKIIMKVKKISSPVETEKEP